MASRPRRSAAQRANEAITDMAENSERTSAMSSRSRTTRTSGASISRGPPSSPDSSARQLNLNIKVSANRLKEATSGRASRSSAGNSRDSFVGGQILDGKRNRGGKKSYVVQSESDEEEEDEDDEVEEDEEEDDDEDAEGEDDEEMDELGDDDAEGEEDDDEGMDVDADGEEDEDAEGEDDDADGDVDMDTAPLPPPTIKISRPSRVAASKSGSKPASRAAPKPLPVLEDDDDEDELSDIEVSDVGDADMTLGGDMLGEEDAEGEEEEEIEVADDDDEEPEEAEDAEEEPDEELDSDDETPGGGSRAETPDLTKMTKRQRARFEEAPQEYMKLSDEVQVKKHFTAEELSMRRAEMARRRRNLSEKRNEEVKMETINKLLKKQAPKINRRAALAGDDTPGEEALKPNAMFVRWVSNKDGSIVGVPEEMLGGPAGNVFRPGGLRSGKMVEEVA